MYDTTNRISFNNLNKWLEETRNYANDKLTIILVGNKNDLENKYILANTGGKYHRTRRLPLLRPIACYLWSLLLKTMNLLVK